MVNHMVQHDTLDRIYSALADSTRRDILTRLGEGPASIGELAEPHGMTLTGMTKHVRVLEESFSVLTPAERDRFEATLRKLRCQVNPEAVQASDPSPLRATAS